MTAEQIDRPPRDESERAAILQVLFDQARELIATEGRVTCPCGRCVGVLTFAYRCLYCGVWFCQECAGRHFAAVTPGAGAKGGAA